MARVKPYQSSGKVNVFFVDAEDRALALGHSWKRNNYGYIYRTRRDT